MVNGSVFLFFRCDSHYIHLAGSGRRYTAKPRLDSTEECRVRKARENSALPEAGAVRNAVRNVRNAQQIAT